MDELQEKIKKLEAEAKENYDKYLRAAADLDNYKKRTAKELEKHLRYGHETLLKELLKVLDDFDNIMAHLPAEDSPGIKNLLDGLTLVHKDFLKILKTFGLKEVETKNRKFDPHFHESLAHVEESQDQEGMIAACHRKGYQLHDRLLRPALVTVAKTKEQTPDGTVEK